MLCCNEAKETPDLASELHQIALDDVREKNVLATLYFLTGCANPYGLNEIVITDGLALTVHHCGNLVFVWQNGQLKRYIVGDWWDIVYEAAQRIKDDYRKSDIQNQLQRIKNKMATENFVV